MSRASGLLNAFAVRRKGAEGQGFAGFGRLMEEGFPPPDDSMGKLRQGARRRVGPDEANRRFFLLFR